jgi:hypothetical protein
VARAETLWLDEPWISENAETAFLVRRIGVRAKEVRFPLTLEAESVT